MCRPIFLIFTFLIVLEHGYASCLRMHQNKTATTEEPIQPKKTVIIRMTIPRDKAAAHVKNQSQKITERPQLKRETKNEIIETTVNYPETRQNSNYEMKNSTEANFNIHYNSKDFRPTHIGSIESENSGLRMETESKLDRDHVLPRETKTLYTGFNELNKEQISNEAVNKRTINEGFKYGPTIFGYDRKNVQYSESSARITPLNVISNDDKLANSKEKFATIKNQVLADQEENNGKDTNKANNELNTEVNQIVEISIPNNEEIVGMNFATTEANSSKYNLNNVENMKLIQDLHITNSRSFNSRTDNRLLQDTQSQEIKESQVNNSHGGGWIDSGDINVQEVNELARQVAENVTNIMDIPSSNIMISLLKVSAINALLNSRILLEETMQSKSLRRLIQIINTNNTSTKT